MVIQRNLGGGKARRPLESDPKSMINQELVLLKIDGFLTPEQAGALKEKANLKDRGCSQCRKTTKINSELWSAEKEKEAILTEMKRLKTENGNQRKGMEELRSRI